jgi:DNA-binding MarR family transcriptional regulator
MITPMSPGEDEVDRLIAGWARERPDLELAPMAAVARLLRAAGLVMAGLERTAREHGIQVAEGDVLFTLRRSGEPFRLQPSDLSAALLVSSGTLTNRLDRLERKGLIERVPHPTDRRSTEVALTEKGFELADGIVAEHVENERRMLSGLDPKELERLDGLLRRLLAGFPGDGDR